LSLNQNLEEAGYARRDAAPNVLLIMLDQYRFDYLGAAGAGFVSTPNADRLAARGVRFTHCFTNSPLCAPARVSLATGLSPTRFGKIANGCHLPRGTLTYYQRLRDHGYRVGCVGKLDLAKTARYNGRHGDRPRVYEWGFTHPEECEGKAHAWKSPEPLGPYGFYLQQRGLYEKFYENYQARLEGKFPLWQDSPLPTDAYEDAYIGRRAAEWIERVPTDFPFHYFVSFVGPHPPFDPPTAYAERYRAAEMPPAVCDSLAGKPERVKSRQLSLASDEVLQMRRQYCASIELIDDHIGKVLEVLEGCGLLENTYVIFTSDHGEMLGDHGLWKKQVAYEPALRVPLLIMGPGIEGNRVSDALIELSDLNPTICELAGLPPQEDIDAYSFAGVLRGETNVHRNDAVSALEGFRCIRTARHKLIVNDDLMELYDLYEDPCELRNIAGTEKELAQVLSRRLAGRIYR
jgi:arylsulfatase